MTGYNLQFLQDLLSSDKCLKKTGAAAHIIQARDLYWRCPTSPLYKIQAVF